MKYFRYVSLLIVLAFAGCDDDEGWIEVQNESGRAITAVMITQCGSEVNGPNELNQGPIPIGGEESFRVGFGCYEVAITTEDNLPGFWEVTVDESSRRVILMAEPPAVVP